MPIIKPIQLPSGKRHITRLAFINRLTDPEAIAIDLASIGDTVQAAMVRRHLNKVDSATYIDLNRPDLRAGLEAMEAAGIFAEGRVDEILDTPIDDIERPQ